MKGDANRSDVAAAGQFKFPMMKTIKPAFRYVNRGVETLFG